MPLPASPKSDNANLESKPDYYLSYLGEGWWGSN